MYPHQEIGDLFSPHRPSAGVDGYRSLRLRLN
jgi:hypothetical protein